MNNLSISLNDLIGLGSFIIMAVGIIKIIFSATKPIKLLQEKVEAHENRLNEVIIGQAEHAKSTRIICKGMLALVEHEITGNSIEKLSLIKAEFQEYLINK